MILRREFLNRTAGAMVAAGTLGPLATELSGSPLGMPIGSQVYPHKNV